MALDPNIFTRKTGEALGAAQAMARERSNSQVAPEHHDKGRQQSGKGIDLRA